MIFIGILASIAAIGMLCWLLFTLAVFALPLFAGVTVGAWAYGTGAGWPGAIAVGFAAGLVTLGVGQLLLVFVKPLWLRLAIAIAFVAPAAIAGYHATHGIVKHTMPSETWQIIISVLGAIAVGVTAFVRVTTMAGPAPSGQRMAAPKRIARRVGRARLACAVLVVSLARRCREARKIGRAHV